MVQNLEVYEPVKRWLSKLESRSDSLSTKRSGLLWLREFCNFHKTNPLSLIRDRTDNLESKVQETRRKHEELLEAFIIQMKRDDYAPNSISTASGMIRSFYKSNYVALQEVQSPRPYNIRMYKIPTIKDIKKMCEHTDLSTRTWILCAKDCVHPDTYIHMTNGELCRIADAESNMDILTANSLTTTIANIQSVFKKDPENTIKIQTAHGQIESSPNHVFCTYENGEVAWKRAKELTTKDYLIRLSVLEAKGQPQALPKLGDRHGRCKIELSSTLTEDFAQVLGYFAGDGCLLTSEHPEGIQFTDKSFLNLQNYSKLIKNLFPCHNPSIKKRERQRLTFYCTTFAKYVKRNFREITEKSRKRSIPSIIQRCPNSVLGAFLKGLFDAEGYVGKRIEFVTTSKAYANQIPLLLLRYGILSKTEERKTQNRILEGKLVVGGKTCYKIIIEGSYALKFRMFIGVSNPDKLPRLNALEMKKKSDCNVIIPILKELLINCIKDTGRGFYSILSSSKLVRKHHPRRGNYSWFYPTSYELKKLSEALPKTSKFHKALDELLNGDIIAERIIAITAFQNQEHLYDLHLPSTSKYFANGFLVHNSGLGNADLLPLSLSNLSSEYGTIGMQLRKGTVPIHIELRRHKTKEAIHSFFGPNAIEVLKQYLNVNGRGRMFTMSARSLQQKIKALSIRTKVATEQVPVHPYSFRKVFNTYMKLAGVNEAIVEVMMGHSIGRVRGTYLQTGSGSSGIGIPISKLAETYMQAYPTIDINQV